MWYDSSHTIIVVKLGKCDTFEDTFTKCDKNEDTPRSLGKVHLILIFYTLCLFISGVMIIQNNILRQKKGKNVASMRIPILFGTKKMIKKLA